MSRRKINALQTVLFILVSTPTLREWKRAYDRGGDNRNTALALLVGHLFLVAAAVVRLRQGIRDRKDPPPESVTIWYLGLLHAAIQYALSKGWLLDE